MGSHYHNWPNPYNIPNCEKKLGVYHRLQGATDNAPFAPNAFAAWDIRQIVHDSPNLPVPMPTGPLYLQARIRLCFGPLLEKPEKLSETDAYEYLPYTKLKISPTQQCCNKKRDQVYNFWEKDDTQICSTFPENSKPSLYGYYCESCHAGTEPAEGHLFGCVPCKPGFFKPTAGMEKCRPCAGKKGCMLIL